MICSKSSNIQTHSMRQIRVWSRIGSKFHLYPHICHDFSMLCGALTIYMFHFGLPRACLYKSPENTHLVPAPPAPERLSSSHDYSYYAGADGAAHERECAVATQRQSRSYASQPVSKLATLPHLIYCVIFILYILYIYIYRERERENKSFT